MTWVALPLVAVFAGYYTLTIRRVGLLSASSIFVYLQLIMALGTLPVLDPAREADRVHAAVLAYTLCAFMVVSACYHAIRPPDTTPPTVTTFTPGVVTAAFIVVSLAVTVAYFLAVGHVALFDGLSNVLFGTRNDVATLRLESYSGSDYLFPGYVNQFKNVLLPALVAITVTFWIRRRHVPYLLAVPLVGAAFVGLVGTGQRGAFVIFVITVVVYVYMLDRRRFPRRAVSLAIIAVPVVLLATLALGRSSDQLTADTGVLGKAAVAATEFQGRILQTNQESSVVAFRYVYEEQAVQNGAEWGRAFVGILPGEPGSDLANRIYYRFYGTDRGTGTESLWASVYHNFGDVGIVLAPVLLALLAGAISNRVRSAHRRSTLTTMGMAGVTTTFGFWVAGPPVFLLNAGILVYLALWFLGARLDRREEAELDAVDEPSLPARVRRGAR